MMNFTKILANHLPFSHEVVDKMVSNWADNKFNFAPTTVFNEEYQIIEPISVIVDEYKEEAVQIFKNLLTYDRSRQIKVDIENLTVVEDEAGVLSKGMKISRAISRGLLDEEIKERMKSRMWEARSLEKVKEDAINEISRKIQKSNVKGNLYLSANPIDYITMSENAAGWSSCHGLDGGFAAGTVSYMQDSSTFIAGLSSAKKQEFEDSNCNKIEWYSKQWRAVVYMSEDGYIIGRQYPFSCDELVDALSELIESTFFAEKKFLKDGGMRVNSGGPVYIDSSEVSRRVVDFKHREIQVAEESCCRECGSWYSEGDVDCASFTCNDCSGIGSMYCECCDERMSEDSATWIEGTHEYVCDYCAGEHYAWCEKCESYHRSDDTYYVDDTTICDSCCSEHTTVCEDCNDTFLNRNCEYREDHDKHLCDDCCDKADEEKEEMEVGKSYQIRSLGACLSGFSVGEKVEVLNILDTHIMVKNLVGIVGYAKRSMLKVLH